MTSPGPRPEPACDADPMGLPELDVARVQRWCAGRVLEHALHQVRVECEVAPRHLTIIERRAPWREDFGPEWSSFPIARLRYSAPTRLGRCPGATATCAFTPTICSRHRGGSRTSSPEYDRDPTGIFWG